MTRVIDLDRRILRVTVSITRKGSTAGLLRSVLRIAGLFFRTETTWGAHSDGTERFEQVFLIPVSAAVKASIE